MSVLGEAQRRALERLGASGAREAAKSLATLLGLPVEVRVSRIETSPFSSVCGESEGRRVSLTLLPFNGDVPGHIIVLFDRKEADELAAGFLRTMIHLEAPTDADLQSTFTEFANIIAGSYVTALAELTHRHLMLATPSGSLGTIEEVSTSVPFGADHDVILMDSQFICNERLLPGQVLLASNAESLATLIG